MSLTALVGGILGGGGIAILGDVFTLGLVAKVATSKDNKEDELTALVNKRGAHENVLGKN